MNLHILRKLHREVLESMKKTSKQELNLIRLKERRKVHLKIPRSGLHSDVDAEQFPDGTHRVPRQYRHRSTHDVRSRIAKIGVPVDLYPFDLPCKISTHHHPNHWAFTKLPFCSAFKVTGSATISELAIWNAFTIRSYFSLSSR